MNTPDAVPGSGGGPGDIGPSPILAPTPAPVVTVRCRENGPLVVELPTGPSGTAILRVTDHRGGAFPLPADKPAVALCRCGQSKNRPFCDGSHRENGFAAAELAPGAAGSR